MADSIDEGHLGAGLCRVIILLLDHHSNGDIEEIVIKIVQEPEQLRFARFRDGIYISRIECDISMIAVDISTGVIDIDIPTNLNLPIIDASFPMLSETYIS